MFIASIPQAPQHGQYAVSLLSAMIDCQIPPGKLSFTLFKTMLSKSTKISLFVQLPTGLMNLNLVCSVALDSEHTGGDTQDGPYQEESERLWGRKMISRFTSWEGQRRLGLRKDCDRARRKKKVWKFEILRTHRSLEWHENLSCFSW